MGKRKTKKSKCISKKEFIFNLISIIILISICLYFGIRSIYYYTEQNTVKTSEILADKIISNNQITKTTDGFHKEEDGYSFKGNVTNNYIKFSNRIYRIMKVYDDNSVKIVSDTNDGILIWGDDSSYKNSNLNIWLDKTELSTSGIYYDTISNSSLLTKTSYTEDILKKSKVTTSKEKISSYITTLTISDYVNSNGKNSYLNNGQYFWLIGNDNEGSNLYVDSTGSVETSNSYESYGVRAVLTLKKDIKTTTGVGTIEDPYVVDMENNNNYIDEYIRLGNDIWQVYSDKDNILKLALNGYININNQEYLSKYSNTTSEYDPTNKYNVAYYLNKTYYNSLSYKDIVLDTSYQIGEISNDTGFKIDNIYTESITCKVGLLNIFDYNKNINISNYYYLNKTSSVGSMVYVNNNLGYLEEEKVTEEKHIVPTISISKTLIKNGTGIIDDPYTVE